MSLYRHEHVHVMYRIEDNGGRGREIGDGGRGIEWDRGREVRGGAGREGTEEEQELGL